MTTYYFWTPSKVTFMKSHTFIPYLFWPCFPQLLPELPYLHTHPISWTFPHQNKKQTSITEQQQQNPKIKTNNKTKISKMKQKTSFQTHTNSRIHFVSNYFNQESLASNPTLGWTLLPEHLSFGGIKERYFFKFPIFAATCITISH